MMIRKANMPSHYNNGQMANDGNIFSRFGCKSSVVAAKRFKLIIQSTFQRIANWIPHIKLRYSFL